MTGTLAEWFPTHRAVWQLTPRERFYRPDELNLKSCELLQPRVLRWYADRIGSLAGADLVAYPLCQAARAAVSGHFGRHPDEVLLFPGTDHAIRVVSEALCAPAGRLVIADPHYDGWSYAAVQHGFQLDAVPMPERAPLRVDALIEALRAGGQAVLVLTQPDSITGQLYSRDDVQRLADAVQEHGSLLVLDTCYLAFAEGGADTVAPAEAQRHVVRLNSFSKSLGLAGARIGALLADESVVDYLARWRPDGMLAGPSLRLLTLALADLTVFEGAWAEVRAARTALAEGLTGARPGWQARPSAANFVAFDAAPDSAAALHTALTAQGIRTRLLSGVPGFPGGIRIATPSAEAVNRVLLAAASAPERDVVMT